MPIAIYQLGGVREDIIGILSIPLGTQRATKVVSDAEAYVRGQTEAGAKQAIPEIRRQVRSEVRPYVVAALALGVGGLLLGWFRR